MPKLLKPKAAAERIDVPDSTLAQWRYLRKGPPYVKVEGHIRYPEDALEAWIAANTVVHEAVAS